MVTNCCKKLGQHFPKKKRDKSFLNTITFYWENDNHEVDKVNGETLSFCLQLVKIYFNIF